MRKPRSPTLKPCFDRKAPPVGVAETATASALVAFRASEGYFLLLNRGITGFSLDVSEQHLHRYLAEFDFRYSNREKLGVDDVSYADLAVKGFAGKRLTYERAYGQA
jgi:hypothetical protein